MRSTAAFIREACDAVKLDESVLFTWEYSRDHPALGRLYEKAKRSQWNATTDIDWSIDVDPMRIDEAQVAGLANDPDSPFASLDQKGLETLSWESLAWTVSQFLHGEQGALLATAKIVKTVPDIDAKYYAATQVMDEARHVEVYDRYLSEKVGRSYPINPHLRALLRDLLADPRWDITYLGMQIMVESLAMAAFGFIYQTTSEPLLKDITFHVMSDEARHVAFGVLSLDGLYADMPAHERRDREDFVCDAAALLRDRLLMREVWENLGLPVDECQAYVRDHPLQQEFGRLLFSKLVPNVKRIGLLTPRVRERFEQLGILQYEGLPSAIEDAEVA